MERNIEGVFPTMIYRALIGLLVILCAVAGPHKPITVQNYRVFHGDGSPAAVDDISKAALQVNVTFIGETHDDAVAHYLEAEILKRVAGSDWALSLEMFERDVQGVVDEYLNGFIEERDLIASGRAWSNYRSDYKALIEIAKEKHMPAIAANAPKRYLDIVSKKGQTGLLVLSAEARQVLPPLPYAAASQAYRERFEREMNEVMAKAKSASQRQSKPIAGHQAESDYALQAQSLWDAAMADSIARFLGGHPGKHVLQINGAFHSEYHQGILEHLERYRPNTTSLVVTILRDKSFPSWKEADMKGAGDFVIVTDPGVKPNRPRKP
jgi:uncharacterized iron-regulated protein